MRLDKEELLRKIAEKGYNIREFSRIIGINPSTFYRKMKNGGRTFTVGEVHKMVEALELDNEESIYIFCSNIRINAS